MWMVMTNYSNGEKMWQILCKALLDGRLPDDIISIKMNRFTGNLAKINVVTRDFTKEDQVYEADGVIVELIKDSGMPVNCIKVLKYKVQLVSINLSLQKRDAIGHKDSVGLSVYIVYISASRWPIYYCPPEKEGNSK
jgi:hypothetical protein